MWRKFPKQIYNNNFIMMDLTTPLKITLIILSSFFLPVAPLCFLVGMSIIADTILGVWAAKKRGDKITSSKLYNIVPKMILYQSAILFGYMIDVWLVGEFLEQIFSINMLMTKVIAMTLLNIEVISLEENFTSISGKTLFKSFRELINKLKNIKNEI